MDTDSGDVKADPVSGSGEGPTADFGRKINDKIDELRKFWRTRRAVFQDLTLAERSSAELGRAGYLPAWKFNLIQSGIAALPALVLKKIADFWVTPAKPQGLEGQVDAVFSWLWPIVIPFVLFFSARVIAWGSIKSMDSSAERRKRATRAYLYLDGAYGLYPQALLSIAVVLSSVGVTLSPWQTITRSVPEDAGSRNALATACYNVGSIVLAAGLLWEGVLKRVILPRRLFPFVGYSRRHKWFWMLADKGRNLGPWNKYIFSYAYAVPAIIVLLGGGALGLSWLIGAALNLMRGAPEA